MSVIRFGLQARAVTVMGATLLVVAVLIGLLLARQASLQDEVRDLGAEVIGGLYDSEVQQRGSNLAADLATALVNPVYYNDSEQIATLVRAVQAQSLVRYVMVFDRQGRLVHDGSEQVAGYGEPMHDAMAAAALAAEAPLIQRDARVLEVAAPVLLGDQRLGGVRVGMDLEQVHAQQAAAGARLDAGLAEVGKRHLLLGLALLGGLFMLTVVVAGYVQRTLVGPIRSLAEAARRIEQGEYGVELSVEGGSHEIGELVSSFDRMSRAIARHDRQVRQLAYTDSLTGLTNRLAFREALEARMAQVRGTSQRLALLFVDVDDFKRVNDTLGHEAGDEVLLRFVERIRQAVEEHGGSQ